MAHATWISPHSKCGKRTIPENAALLGPGRELMGVFADEKLVAYVTMFIYGQSLRIYASRFDPAYSKSYPMYPLYYTIATHYLNEKGCKEIDSGCRPLLHETNIGDFRLHLGW